MVLKVAHNFHATAVGQHLVTFRNIIAGVVGAFGLHVRTDLANQCAHIGFLENYDCVYVRESCNNLGAFNGRHQRTAFALQLANGFVGIHRDNQLAPERFRSLQVTHMSDMQQIETTIGQNDLLTIATPLVDALPQLFARKNFLVALVHVFAAAY